MAAEVVIRKCEISTGPDQMYAAWRETLKVLERILIYMMLALISQIYVKNQSYCWNGWFILLMREIVIHQSTLDPTKIEWLSTLDWQIINYKICS